LRRVSYKKLWKLLIDIYLNKQTLAQMSGISSATLSKMVKGECVNLEILVKICNVLECDVHDILELVPEEELGCTKFETQLPKN
jgi:DNA-binding Xre family transcriptional regulator